jgi:hypothetical protein
VDPVSKAILKTVADLGYVVTIGGHSNGVEVAATSDVAKFIVRAGDLYECAVEIAERVSMDLADG